MIPKQLFERIERIGRLQRLAVFAVTLLVLAGIFIYTVYLPKERRITELKAAVEALEERIAQAKLRARNLALLEEELLEVKDEFMVVLRILPDSREIPSLLRDISRQGEDSRLEFLLFSPQKEVEKDFFIDIPVAIEVRGRYHDVVSFFSKVGMMARIVNIINVSMQPEKPLSTTLIARCTAVTYRFKEQAGEETP